MAAYAPDLPGSEYKRIMSRTRITVVVGCQQHRGVLAAGVVQQQAQHQPASRVPQQGGHAQAALADGGI